MVDVLFPIVTGPAIAALKSGLAGRAESYTDDVNVSRKRPAVPVARMVTVRDDGGPAEGVQTRKQVGVNVWAETSVNAERLALMCMGLMNAAPDGNPITSVDNMAGPYEVVDDESDLLVVDGVTLSHFFFTARVSARGTDL